VRYTSLMAERATTQRLMSVEEYLEFERNSPVKHEYVGGHVYAMVGVSRRHSRIAGNIFRRLADAAEGGPCRVHQSDMKVPTPGGAFYYPDVVVACGEEPEDEYYEDAPCLIAEVLSESTEAKDRREKLIAYRNLDSLVAYLIVAQDEAAVERHYRDAHGEWHAEVIVEGEIPIPCPPGAKLTLGDVYEGL
jgi:Uma2 family endonuclease